MPPKSDFFIYTATFCLPSQIWIIFKIHTETCGALALISADTPCWSSTLPHSLRRPIPWIIERLKYNKMEFYLIFALFYASYPLGNVFRLAGWWKPAQKCRILHWFLMVSARIPDDKWGHNLVYCIIQRSSVRHWGVGYINQYPLLSASLPLTPGMVT